MSDGALLDLVCGPASPLPETRQRYRLLAHLASGGQSEVYRAVRVSAGVSPVPVAVKVFRTDPRRPVADELRLWDNGDAVLMDLNNRGVGGICRRLEGFYGPPPHHAGQPPPPVAAVPYQVLEYLDGLNLLEYCRRLARGMGPAPAGPAGEYRLNALVALHTLAGVLRALHHPPQPPAMPVVHFDIRPTNVMVLAGGGVRLIDFTGARYRREDRHGGPACDVRGFGGLAYYLITGGYPTGDTGVAGCDGMTGYGGAAGSAEAPLAPWSVLCRHPVLDAAPGLRDHLHASLADRPSDLLGTMELGAWAIRLGRLARQARLPDLGIDWAEPASVEAAHAEPGYPEHDRTEVLVAARPTSPPAVAMRGRAKVPPPKAPRRVDPPIDAVPASLPRVVRPPWRERMRTLKRGRKVSATGALFAFICWSIWAGSSHGRLLGPIVAFVTVLAVAVGVFVLARLVGRLVLERRLGRLRRSAKGAHALTGLFLAAAGVAYLQQTPWVVDAVAWLQDNLR